MLLVYLVIITILLKTTLLSSCLSQIDLSCTNTIILPQISSKRVMTSFHIFSVPLFLLTICTFTVLHFWTADKQATRCTAAEGATLEANEEICLKVGRDIHSEKRPTPVHIGRLRLRYKAHAGVVSKAWRHFTPELCELCLAHRQQSAHVCKLAQINDFPSLLLPWQNSTRTVTKRSSHYCSLLSCWKTIGDLATIVLVCQGLPTASWPAQRQLSGSWRWDKAWQEEWERPVELPFPCPQDFRAATWTWQFQNSGYKPEELEFCHF